MNKNLKQNYSVRYVWYRGKRDGLLHEIYSWFPIIHLLDFEETWVVYTESDGDNDVDGAHDIYGESPEMHVATQIHLQLSLDVVKLRMGKRQVLDYRLIFGGGGRVSRN